MRQHIEVDGKWMQRRAKGKMEGYSLCQSCVQLGLELFPCKKAAGMANFCAATKVSIVIWACSEFEPIEEEVEEKEDDKGDRPCSLGV